MFTPTDLVVVFLPFPHYRGGYYLKSVTSRHRNSQRPFGVTTFLDSVIRSPKPLSTASDLRFVCVPLGQGFASLLHNLALLRESGIFQPLRK